MLKFGTKNALFGYFWARILKHYCHIWNQYSRICLIAKFLQKNKNAKIWDQKCLISYLAIFGLEFEKTVVIFEISTPEFVKKQNFVKNEKWKCLNLGPKMPYLGIFGLEVLKNYCHIWNQHPWIYLTAKFCEKNKNV